MEIQIVIDFGAKIKKKNIFYVIIQVAIILGQKLNFLGKKSNMVKMIKDFGAKIQLGKTFL